MENTCKKLRERILEASAQLIIEQGVRNTTLELIAQKAATTKMGILRLFDSKEHLVATVFESLDAQTQQHWQHTVQVHGGGAAGVLALIDSVAQSFKSNPMARGCPLALSSAEHNMFSALVLEAEQDQNTHQPWERLHAIAENHKKALYELIQKALEKDGIANASVKALWLVHAICGLYLNRGTYFGQAHQNDSDSMLQWIKLILENNTDE